MQLNRITKMAAAYHKRRAGLSAILKNHLATVAPRLYSEGVISSQDCEVAIDGKANKRERANGLVVAIGKKIKTDEKVLKDVLRILREIGVGRLYVAIMEAAAQRPQENGGSSSNGGDGLEDSGRDGVQQRTSVKHKVKALPRQHIR